MLIYLIVFCSILILKAEGSPKLRNLENFKTTETSDWNLTSDKIIITHDYPEETHHVTTSDGYVLTLFRIPGKKGFSLQNAKEANAPPVIVQHGFKGSSDSWLCNDKYSLAFVLADYGFDVWLTNARGNRYSNSNIYMSPDDDEFWDYDFEDLGLKDSTAYIDYILEETGYSKVSYVAHSQGTTQMFILLSMNQTYQQKLNCFGAMGPVATLKHMRGLGDKIVAYTYILSLFDKIFHPTEIYAFSQKKAKRIEDICVEKFPWLCNWYYHITNMYKADNETGYIVYKQHYPAGSSFKDLLHFMELIRNGFIRYRASWNDPKEYYDLSTITNVPIALFVGAHDVYATKKNVQWLLGQLNPYVVKETKWYEDYGHSSYIYVKEDYTQYQDDLIEFLIQYQNI